MNGGRFSSCLQRVMRNSSLFHTCLCLSLAAAFPTVAGAEELRENPNVVLELFTSQSCAASPQADALFSQFAEAEGVIALAYHVDYWDYSGWRDTFGEEANSHRQRAYVARWGNRRLYTPHLVVNGAKGLVGSKRDEAEAAVAGAILDLPVSISVDDGILSIDIEGQAGAAESVVWLVTFLDRASVEIESGVNQGKTLTYTNIVTGRQVLGTWEPDNGGAQFRLPITEVLDGASNGAAVLVQDSINGLPGPIRGAASYRR